MAQSTTLSAERRSAYASIEAILPITELPLIAAIAWFSVHPVISLVSGLFFPVFSVSMFKLSKRLDANLEPFIMAVNTLNLGFLCWVSGPSSPSWLEGIMYMTALMYTLPKAGMKLAYLVVALVLVTAANWATGRALPEVVGISMGLAAIGAILMRTLRVVMLQNDEIEALLLNIFPPAIASELKAYNAVQPVLHPAATVLFTDFKGFTTAAERMTAGELVADLDAVFSSFDAIINRRGLVKLKTIGDSYMCAGGVPDPSPTHAVDCALAALEIRELMLQTQNERRAEGRATWEVRIGLHTGPLVAGVIGKLRFAYDVWGDTVNTASRMESAGAPGEINASAELAAALQPWFVCEPRGRLPVKGKGELEMFFVKRVLPELSANEAGTVPNEEFKLRYARLAASPKPVPRPSAPRHG
jgi:class 3 adenylate cyclase